MLLTINYEVDCKASSVVFLVLSFQTIVFGVGLEVYEYKSWLIRLFTKC